MRKSFKDSLKALEADIQHANTLASDYSREYDGACLQMRLSYSPCADIFLFLFQWTDCRLAGVLGLIRILIYKVVLCFMHDVHPRLLHLYDSAIIMKLVIVVYGDGKTTMSVYERKASLITTIGKYFETLLDKFQCFPGVIFPSLLQLHKGITDIEEKKQRRSVQLNTGEEMRWRKASCLKLR
ncbi:UNVERIFIED_CONTAM: E3 ubiquitin-protein ligase AIRP2 [Sesamum calycinum]|uniref:E3 ubiquitin-protein ligase AIRP2 n=1 Tax=Sesamum calycinum TaxID=2727403 RepID=A0AAW2MYG1_9LAMI